MIPLSKKATKTDILNREREGKDEQRKNARNNEEKNKQRKNTQKREEWQHIIEENGGNAAKKRAVLMRDIGY